jgi:hypothetical protein
MKTVLLSTLAAVAIAATASTAAAQLLMTSNNGGSRHIVRIDDNRYYDLPFGVKIEKPYKDPNDSDWGDSDYSNEEIKSPQWIARNLERNDYEVISEPDLVGRSYRVMAIDPNGRDVKMRVDARSGEIERIDFI